MPLCHAWPKRSSILLCFRFSIDSLNQTKIVWSKEIVSKVCQATKRVLFHTKGTFSKVCQAIKRKLFDQRSSPLPRKFSKSNLTFLERYFSHVTTFLGEKPLGQDPWRSPIDSFNRTKIIWSKEIVSKVYQAAKRVWFHQKRPSPRFAKDSNENCLIKRAVLSLKNFPSHTWLFWNDIFHMWQLFLGKNR